MDEKTLTALCLISSVCGIIIIAIANKIIEPVSVDVINVSLDKKYVKITGSVVSVFTSKDGNTFLKLKDSSGIIDAVIFKNSLNENLLKPSVNITVIGKPQMYKGKIEVIATKLLFN